MPINNTLSAGFDKILDIAGELIRIRYYLQEAGSVWDDDVELALISGSEVWCSGVVMPLSRAGARTSEDVVLVEQGKLRNEDQKLYVNGSLDFTGVGSNFRVEIGMNGSPNPVDEYTIIPVGGVPYEAGGTQIYKRAYIRRSTVKRSFLLTELREYLTQEDGYKIMI